MKTNAEKNIEISLALGWQFWSCEKLELTLFRPPEVTQDSMNTRSHKWHTASYPLQNPSWFNGIHDGPDYFNSDAACDELVRGFDDRQMQNYYFAIVAITSGDWENAVAMLDHLVIGYILRSTQTQKAEAIWRTVCGKGDGQT